MKKHGFSKILGVAAAGLLLAGFSTSLWGDEKRYVIRPEISVPEYKTDTVRLIEMYQRLMDDYMSLTKAQMTETRTDIHKLSDKLDSMDRKLTILSAQVSAIQAKLGIESPQQPKPASVPHATATEKHPAEH